jgi:drug/metabolite transporter (DMT)-like permease
LPTRKRMIILLIAGVAAISTSAILIRLADAPPPVIAFYRMFFGALFFAPLALKDLFSQKLKKQHLLSALTAGAFLALHFLLWMTSLKLTSVASSVVLVATQPIWVFLMAAVFLGEKPTGAMWLGLSVAVLGSVLVGSAQSGAGSSKLAGDLLALGGAVMMAAYFIVARRLRQSLPLALYSALTLGSASIVLALYIMFAGLPWTGYSGRTWIMFVSLALVPTVLGHNTLNWALKYVPATMVSATILGEPLGSTILAVFVLGEVPALREVLGGLITLLGIFLVWRADALEAQGES